MNWKNMRRELVFGLTLLGFCPTISQAQEMFADDFSESSYKYTVRTEFSGESPSVNSGAATLQATGLLMTGNSINGDAVDTRLDINEQTNAFILTGSFDESTISLSQDAWVQISAEGSLFNDTFNVGDSNETNEGDINISLASAVFSNGSTNLYVCIGRNGPNGYEEFPFFADGNHCKQYPDQAPLPGSQINMGFSIGAGNTVTLTLGNQTDVLDFPDTFFPPAYVYRGVRHTIAQGVGGGSFLLNSIQTDSGAEQFTAAGPVVNRYRLGLPDDNFPTTENNRLRVARGSPADSGRSTNLNVNAVTDYLEALVELSSQSIIDAPGNSVYAGIRSISINDIADGGQNGATGDVRADIYLDARHNGLRRAEYCLSRYEDAAGDNRTGLLQSGAERCLEFPVKVKFDQPYRLAIEVDRNAPSITFRLDGFSHTESLPFTPYDAARPEARVELGASRGADVLGYIDDVRNSSSVLTAAEILSGESVPTAFPATPDESSLAVDSTIDVPFDYGNAADFIDDFSADTTLIGFEQWGEAESGVSYANGAIELQVHSNRDPSDGGGATVFYIVQPTDSIRVRGAVSSNSNIPAGNRGEASLDIEAVFHNDTANGGYNERAGDIEAKLRIRFEGNGRARVEAELRREDESGNRERLALFPDGEDRYGFNEFKPELDVAYDLGIRLDRASQSMVFSLDNQEVSVPLMTDVFVPASRRIQVRAYHQGTSGRAAVNLFSISTDDASIDFTAAKPLLAPYRPAYDSRSPGSSVTVSDGRLKLATDGRVPNSSNTAQLRVRGTSQYVGADIELSSESVVSATGSAYVGVSGSLYADMDNGQNNSEGTVFAALRLTATGDQGRYVEYCAFRSNDENFDDTAELLGGDPENCPRFAIVPELDTAYPASISLDQSALTLTYQFADEIFVYDIGTDIVIDDNQFNGVRARSSDDSSAVAYVDNLSFSATPTPLAQSDDNFGNAAGDSGTGTTDQGTGSTAGSGGGGCSIGAAGGNWMFPLLILSALVGLRRRSWRKLSALKGASK